MAQPREGRQPGDTTGRAVFHKDGSTDVYDRQGRLEVHTNPKNHGEVTRYHDDGTSHSTYQNGAWENKNEKGDVSAGSYPRPNGQDPTGGHGDHFVVTCDKDGVSRREDYRGTERIQTKDAHERTDVPQGTEKFKPVLGPDDSVVTGLNESYTIYRGQGAERTSETFDKDQKLIRFESNEGIGHKTSEGHVVLDKPGAAERRIDPKTGETSKAEAGQRYDVPGSSTSTIYHDNGSFTVNHDNLPGKPTETHDKNNRMIEKTFNGELARYAYVEASPQLGQGTGQRNDQGTSPGNQGPDSQQGDRKQGEGSAQRSNDSRSSARETQDKPENRRHSDY
ncbi:hypothetical protein [Lapillicoccus sp.]|uniref:hypothetical protein n=1 Tax=Lapillicoccus sp. TaxID=1909287 RepID=UPI00326730E2